MIEATTEGASRMTQYTKEIGSHGFSFETFRNKRWMYRTGGQAFNDGRPQWRSLWTPLGGFGWYKIVKR